MNKLLPFMHVHMAGLSEGKRQRLSSAAIYRGVITFDLFPCPVCRFLCFKLSAFLYLFITASLWKKWDTLSKFTSSQGFSLPLRLESAICCKALGNNIEFEIHYSVLIRFILKNLCVHWPWLGKWYHKIRIFFSFSYSIIFSVARNGFVWQYTCKCQCICHLQLSGCSVRFPVIMSEKTVSATLNKMCLVKIASNFFSRHIMTW